jgi:transcription termination factor NusB
MFTDIPVSIAINEALEVDKKFDKDDAPTFINGVLNALAKACRAE